MLKRTSDVTDLSYPASRRPRPGFSWTTVIVTVVLSLGVVALLLPATRNAREPARRSQCKNNLKQIGLALHQYHDEYKAFPPAYTTDAQGNRLHSWRTLILPYMEQRDLYDKIDLSKPWDDPVNQAAFKTHVIAYVCPASSVPRGQTTYLAILGPHTCLQPTKPRHLSEIRQNDEGPLLVIEVPVDQAIHWMSPYDTNEQLVLAIDSKSKEAHSSGFHGLHANGSVQFQSAQATAKERQRLIGEAPESSSQKTTDVWTDNSPSRDAGGDTAISDELP